MMKSTNKLKNVIRSLQIVNNSSYEVITKLIGNMKDASLSIVKSKYANQ